MRYLFLTLLVLNFSLLSCGEDAPTDGDEINEESQTSDNFTIEGEIEGASNMTFYLEAQSQNGAISVSEAKADAHGAFKMVGNIPDMGLYQLRMGEQPNETLLLTIVPEDHLKLKATRETYTANPKASGTVWAKTMERYMVLVDDFRTQQESLAALQASLSEKELEEKILSTKAVMDEFALSEMKMNPANPYNIVLSTYAVPSTSFKDWNTDYLDALKSVSLAFNENYSSSAISTMMAQQVYQIEMAYSQYQAMNSGTRVAPEIALKNPEGIIIPLSSLRGKYVLIDFWASWCAPCRRENPNVIRLYNKYKDKGFTVYSVSLDQNAEHWKAAIEKDGLIWPNHVSDLLQWNTPLTKEYGFSSIPHTVLIDKEGKIIGTGLRGQELEQKLNEIFSN